MIELKSQARTMRGVRSVGFMVLFVMAFVTALDAQGNSGTKLHSGPAQHA